LTYSKAQIPTQQFSTAVDDESNNENEIALLPEKSKSAGIATRGKGRVTSMQPDLEHGVDEANNSQSV
jgi:hypothetical protein